MVWKTFLAKRTDDARGSWVLQENPSSGDKLDIILFPSKKYLGTLPAKYGKNRS